MVTPKSLLYRSQVFGLCGLSSSSRGRHNLWRVWREFRVRKSDSGEQQEDQDEAAQTYLFSSTKEVLNQK